MKCILFVVAMMLSFSAHAATTNYTRYYVGDGYQTPRYTTPEAACSGATPKSGTSNLPWTGTVSGMTCVWKDSTGANRATNPVITVNVTCTDPQIPNSLGVCSTPPPPQCTAGKTYEITVRAGYTDDDVGLPSNYGGCAISVDKVVNCYSEGKDATGKTPAYCKFEVTESGSAAPAGSQPAVSDTQAPDAKPEKVPPFNPATGKGCPAGTVSLGIDSTGGSICGGSGTSPIEPTKTEIKTPPVTTTNPDGSTTKVESTTRTNSDGSTTTTTTTTVTGANGGTTVTQSTSTSQKPSGGSGTNDSTDDKKDDFCVKNPNLNVCKNSQVSGSCDDVACTGDAIQCAIYRSQQKSYCELNKENPSSTLGNQVVGGNDPLKSTLPTKENATQINMAALDQAGFLGGGSCFQDKTFNVQGLTVTLPFSKVCPYLEWLRYVVMVIAALVSLKIVSKPVLGD